MGGATVPTPGGSTGAMAFPSQAEPNPIPFGLRGKGPEQFINPITPPVGPPAGPGGPGTPPAGPATPGYGLYQIPGSGGSQFDLFNQGNIYQLGYGGTGLSSQNDAFLANLGYNTANGALGSAPNLPYGSSSFSGGPLDFLSNPMMLGSNFAQVGTYDPSNPNAASFLNGGLAPTNNPYSQYNQQQVNTYNQSGMFSPFAGQYANLPSNANSLNLGQSGTNAYGIGQNLTQSGPYYLPQV